MLDSPSPKSKEQDTMVEQLLTCWGLVSGMALGKDANRRHPSSPSKTAGSSSSSGGSATLGNIRGGLTSWVMAPNIRAGLPCMAELLHAYLQQPGRAARSVKEGHWLSGVTQQLQAWVAMAASAQAPRGAVPAEHIVWIKRFLWADMATVAAAQKPTTLARRKRSDGSRPPTASSSSSSKVPSEFGGYAGVEMYLDGMYVTTFKAAAALLQLAAAESLACQLLEKQAWAGWLRAYAPYAAGITVPGFASSSRVCKPQQQPVLAAHYLCWPPTQGAVCSCTSNASSAANNSSNRSVNSSGPLRGSPTRGPGACTCSKHGSSNVGPGAADPLTPTARLLSLAHAASVTMEYIKFSLGNNGDLSCRADYFTSLMRQLVLLVQQLQHAPAQVRSDFLHSSPGTFVLQAVQLFAERCEFSFPVGVAKGAAPEAAQVLQQRMGATPGRQGHQLDARAIVQLLLLPGLLLQPQPCAGAAGGSITGVTGGTGATTSSRGSSGIGQGVHAGSHARAVLAPVPSGSHVLPLFAGDGIFMPLALPPCSSLQLAPGFTPPPIAFIMTEALLRSRPTPEAIDLAIQLLTGTTHLIRAAGQKGRKSQGAGRFAAAGVAGAAKQAALAELYTQAYCSLASSLMQAITHYWVSPCAIPQLLQLADNLLAAACQEGAAASSRRASMGPAGGTSSSHDGRGSAPMTSSRVTSTGSDSPGGGGKTNKGGCWSLAACLAAATALGVYTAHVTPAVASTEPHATGSSTQPQAGSPSGASSAMGSAANRATGSSNTSSKDSGSAQGAGRGSTGGAGPAGCGLLFANCSVCTTTARLFTTLRRLELGLGVTTSSAAAGLVALAEAAKNHGVMPHQYLQQHLQALVTRHPVPGVCSNLGCHRRNGQAAVTLVRNRVGSLCGGCKAAWYCCEGCQSAAWAQHKKVCGRHSPAPAADGASSPSPASREA